MYLYSFGYFIYNGLSVYIRYERVNCYMVHFLNKLPLLA